MIISISIPPKNWVKVGKRWSTPSTGKRVLRLFRPGATADGVAQRTVLLQEITAGADAVPFEIPIVIEQAEMFGRVYTIEKRIRGVSLLDRLRHVQGESRDRLIERYMEAGLADRPN